MKNRETNRASEVPVFFLEKVQIDPKDVVNPILNDSQFGLLGILHVG